MDSKIFKSEKIFGLDPRLLTFFWPVLIELGVLFLSMNLVIMPKIEEIKELRQRKNEVDAEIQAINDKKSYLSSIDEIELDEKIVTMNRSVLPTNDAYYLVNLVRKVVAEYGYEVVSFSIKPGKIEVNPPEEMVKPATAGRIEVTMVMAGPGDKYVDLLSRLEGGFPIMSIENLEMSGLGGANTQMAMNLVAFHQSEIPKKDLSKLNIVDLKLSKEETELFTKISGYQGLAEMGFKSLTGETRPFLEYQREDPFSF